MSYDEALTGFDIVDIHRLGITKAEQTFGFAPRGDYQENAKPFAIAAKDTGAKCLAAKQNTRF